MCWVTMIMLVIVVYDKKRFQMICHKTCLMLQYFAPICDLTRSRWPNVIHYSWPNLQESSIIVTNMLNLSEIRQRVLELSWTDIQTNMKKGVKQRKDNFHESILFCALFPWITSFEFVLHHFFENLEAIH